MGILRDATPGMFDLIATDIRKLELFKKIIGVKISSGDLYVIIDNHVMEFNNNELLEIMWNSIMENKTISEYILDII